MLVRFTDTKEKVVWINPVHVKLVVEKKAEVTSIVLNVPATAPVNVRMPVDTVAELLNAAMPLDPYAGAIDDDAGHADNPGAGPGVIAASL